LRTERGALHFVQPFPLFKVRARICVREKDFSLPNLPGELASGTSEVPLVNTSSWASVPNGINCCLVASRSAVRNPVPLKGRGLAYCSVL
jgi:hypothetical protein